jgi:hypothetical protein
MTSFNAQKAEKLTIREVAQRKLDGDFLKAFDDFIVFLENEDIKLPWKSINGFKMTYKGEHIGAIHLGAGGWLDNAIEKKNHLNMHVYAYGGNFDEYLDGQNAEVIDLFMERIENKCVHCRPTCGCSRASGRTVHVAGKAFENVCNNASVYNFDNVGSVMREMTMNSPCAVYPPIPIRPVPLETVKKLILARKAYITKSLASEKTPKSLQK